MPAAVPFIIAATAVAGVGLAAYGAVQSSNSAKALATAQKRSEALQLSQMQLDARRRRVEVMRQAQFARSKAVAASVGQGAGVENSGLFGGYGSIAGETNKNTLGINESEMLGGQNFLASSQAADARAGAALGSGLSSLGGSLISSLGPLKDLAGGFGPAPARSSPAAT